MDAGRDAVYAAAYEADGEKLVSLGDARRLVLGDELRALLVGLPPPLEVVPDGEEMLARLSRHQSLESYECTILDPEPLGRSLACAVSAERSWCGLVSAAELTPIYFGPSQAERARGLDLDEETHRPHPPQQDGGV
jgi:hypothetical protein